MKSLQKSHTQMIPLVQGPARPARQPMPPGIEKPGVFLPDDLDQQAAVNIHPADRSESPTRIPKTR